MLAEEWVVLLADWMAGPKAVLLAVLLAALWGKELENLCTLSS